MNFNRKLSGKPGGGTVTNGGQYGSDTRHCHIGAVTLNFILQLTMHDETVAAILVNEQ